MEQSEEGIASCSAKNSRKRKIVAYQPNLSVILFVLLRAIRNIVKSDKLDLSPAYLCDLFSRSCCRSRQ
jgi:hypothetical protein